MAPDSRFNSSLLSPDGALPAGFASIILRHVENDWWAACGTGVHFVNHSSFIHLISARTKDRTACTKGGDEKGGDENRRWRKQVRQNYLVSTTSWGDEAHSCWSASSTLTTGSGFAKTLRLPLPERPGIQGIMCCFNYSTISGGWGALQPWLQLTLCFYQPLRKQGLYHPWQRWIMAWWIQLLRQCQGELLKNQLVLGKLAHLMMGWYRTVKCIGFFLLLFLKSSSQG